MQETGQPSRPIATPLAQRWKQIRSQALPAVVFLLAAGLVALLWRQEVAPTRMVGEVYAQSSDALSPRPGVVERLHFQLFDTVEQGDVIALIRWSPAEQLAAEQAVLQAEMRLSELGGLDPALDQQRNLLNWHQLHGDWVEASGQLQVLQVRLAQAERDWSRARSLRDQRFLPEADYEGLESAYLSLQAEVDAQRKLVASLERARLLTGAGSATAEPDIQAARAATRAWQQKRLELLQAEAEPVLLRAPISGVITALHQQQGGFVDAGLPLATIRSTQPLHIVGYLRQPASQIPEEGSRIDVITRGDRKLRAEARVRKVGPQFEPLGPAFVRPFAEQEERALPLLISLPEGLSLRPGEIVDLRPR
jgi:multidrug resistance efflux pump